jgi:PAS domain S-box-containing protein
VIGAVNMATNLSVLLEPVLDAALELINFRCGGIYLLRDHADTAELVCWKGASADCVAGLNRISVVQSSDQAVCVNGDAGLSQQDGAPLAEPSAKGKATSVVRAPIISQDRIIGAMIMTNHLAHVFTGEEKGILQSIGRQLGAAIAKMRSEIALRESEEKYRMLSEQSLAGIQIIKDGRLIFVNDGWSRIVGCSREEALAWGKEEFVKIVHPDDRGFFQGQVSKKQAGISEGALPVYDCRFLSRDGATKWVLIHSKAIWFADGLAIVGVVVDITDRKLAEQALAEANRRLKAGEERLMAANQELSSANRDKEVLLKEIHHRVKNNLQVISSLLKLQLGHVQDALASAVIRECQNRIKSIAIVHEKLYQSGNLANIDLGEYIRSLINHLFRTFLVEPDSIRTRLEVEHVALNVDQAIPCCLIINELVTNALKYAFPGNQTGEIAIRLKSEDAPLCILEVSDNGIGFPLSVDFRNSSSLGMQLVMTFVEQLKGTISLDARRGTSFTIRFAGEEKNAASVSPSGVSLSGRHGSDTVAQSIAQNGSV